MLAHVVLTVLLPRYVTPEPRLPDEISFAVLMQPEPEEIVQEEPEVLDEPEPIVRPEPIREAPIEETIEEPIDEEPQHEAETTEVEDTSEHSADASDSIAGTVSSSEGGLLVARRAGVGSDGSAHGRAPRPAVAERVGIDRRRVVRDYLRQVQRALGAPRFTRALQRAEVEGVVMVGLRIDAAGRVHAVRVKESSGHTLIDEAALAHVQQVEDVPAPPDVLDWVTREITLPVRYVRR